MKRKKVVSCGALPWRLNEDKVEVLLIKQFKHRDSWGCAKGHINDGESLEQCAVREVKEETGLRVSLEVRLPPVVTAYGDEEKTVHCWLAKPIGSFEPNISDPDCEIAEARWWNIQDLPLIHPYQKPLIVEAIKLLTVNGDA